MLHLLLDSAYFPQPADMKHYLIRGKLFIGDFLLTLLMLIIKNQKPWEPRKISCWTRM